MGVKYDRVKKIYDGIQLDFQPEVAIVLGSGLGDFADNITIEKTISYNDIEGFPTSTVSGHKGRFVFGYVNETKVVIMQGRVHYYEGYPIEDVVLPIRLMAMMGAKILFLTNAAGGINTGFHPGDFMVIRDQIADFVPSPLIGSNEDQWGTRFPPMGDLYDDQLAQIIKDAGEKSGTKLQEGVYIQLTGPNYETKAEVRMCQILGADAVGMSTAVEAIAGHHMGMKVCGFSCITNMGCGLGTAPLSHEEVKEISAQVAPKMKRIMELALDQMGRMEK